MMHLSLGKWWSCSSPEMGAVETPDARALSQRVKVKEGVREVQVCKDVFWEHLTHVALVTELIEGREDERRLRRSVRKIGMDPHFAYAWMLTCVAWVRAHGTEQILLPGPEATAIAQGDSPYRAAARDADAYMAQIREALPGLFPDPMSDKTERFTCGTCTNRDACGKCTVKGYRVEKELPACEFYDPNSDDDDGYE